MGFFDNIFGRKEKTAEPKGMKNVPTSDYEISRERYQENKIMINFTDNRPKENGVHYNTTRLIMSNLFDIKDEETNFKKTVCNCSVSWYNNGDTVFLDSEFKGEPIDANKYKGVWADIDWMLMQTDNEYSALVMRELLNKDNVLRTIEEGLQVSPTRPCGKYIGGVKERQELEGDEKEEELKNERNKSQKYATFFSEKVGEVAHKMPLMVNRRNEKRQQELLENKKNIERQIEEASKGIDRLEALKAKLAELQKEERELNAQMDVFRGKDGNQK